MPNDVRSYFLFTWMIMLMIESRSTNPTPYDIQKVKVVIVGSGVAGIGAAQKLMLNNITDVIILEAMNHIGGRIQGMNLGRFGGVDMGAHWIHGEGGNVLYEIGKPLGIVDHSGDYKNLLFFSTDGSQLKLPLEFLDIYYKLFGDIHEVDVARAYKSYKDLIDHRVATFGQSLGLATKDIRSLQRHAAMNLCILEGCNDIADVSLNASLNYQEGSGDRLTHWISGGMSNILHLLMGTHTMSPWKGLGVNKKVRVTSRVMNVNWSQKDGPVIVKTQFGSIIAADFVIFTPSLNVLKKKHTSLFTPSLPIEKVCPIQALGMDVVDKIFLVFPSRWWPKNVSGFVPLHDRNYVSSLQDWGQGIVSFVGENHNPLVLGTWISGEAARAMEKASDYEVRTTVLRVLKQALKKTYSVPEPVFVIRSRWWENQDVIGSYSFNSIASETLIDPRGTLAAPLAGKNGKPMVLFAGEATSSNYYGTVNGALESGWREAQRIIDYLNYNRRTG